MQNTEVLNSPDAQLKADRANLDQGGKRRRALIACSSCRRRKIRCDSSRPHCGNCVRAGLDCTYSSERKRKRSKTSEEDNKHYESHQSKIAQRLDKVEAMLTALLKNQGINVKSVAENLQNGDADHSTAYSSADSSDVDNDSQDDSDGVEDGDRDDYEDGVASSLNVDGHQMQRGTGTSSDIFQLNERRAPVIVKFGGLEPLVTFTYGFIPTLLSPKSMRWLCECIGHHTLGVQSEAILSRIWKYKTGKMLEWGKTTVKTKELDPRFIRAGIEMHEKSTSDVIFALIDKADIELINKVCCTSDDYTKIEYSSPYSLVYPTLVMLFTQHCATKTTGQSNIFSEEEIAEQNAAAFQACLKQMPQFSLAPCTFLLLRLLILAIYSISRKVMIPHYRGLISHAIFMALNIGLHNREGERRLSAPERERRTLIWAMLQDLDIKTACSLSLMPLISNYDHATTRFKLKYEPGSDLESFATTLELDNIYARVYQLIFSRKARRTSVKTMLLNLCKLDDKLLKWEENLPPRFMETIKLVEEAEERIESQMKTGQHVDAKRRQSYPDGMDNVGVSGVTLGPGISREMTTGWIHVSSMIAYYTILILIHSIPAFSPSCLNVFKDEEIPSRLTKSLSIISESARNMLKMSFNMRRVQSDECLGLTATNAFSSLFLKQIRDPRHPTNSEDLVLIYRYISRFRAVTTSSASDMQGMMNVWLLFANALTQLNREYPSPAASFPHNESGTSSTTDSHHGDKERTDPGYPSCSQSSKPLSPSESFDLLHQQAAAQKQFESDSCLKSSAANQSAPNRSTAPVANQSAPNRSAMNGSANGPAANGSVANGSVHRGPGHPAGVVNAANQYQFEGSHEARVNGSTAPPPPYYAEVLQQNPQMVAHDPQVQFMMAGNHGMGQPQVMQHNYHGDAPMQYAVPQPLPHDPNSMAQAQGLNMPQFTPASPPPRPAMAYDHSGGNLGHSGETSLWETFSGMAGVDIDINEEELMRGIDSTLPDMGTAPDNCVIC